ncbi:SBBP repeat-containing protein, partial [Flavobacterium pedocola]
MRKIYSFLLFILSLTSSNLYAQADPQLDWVFSAVGTPMGGNSEGRSIAVDAAGNRYVIGNFKNTADFDPSPAAANLTSTGGSQDFFIAKYDASGNYVWAKAIGGISNNENGMSIAIDATGQLYVVGNFEGTTDFDPSASTANLVSTVNTDFYIAKYDNNGNYLWAKSLEGGNSEDYISIALNSVGEIFITGYYNSSPDFDPSAGTGYPVGGGAGNNSFIAKYDNNGSYLWVKAMGGTGNVYSYDLAIDSSGQVHITGGFLGTGDFDPSGATANLTTAGDWGGFFAKYDSNGNYIWAKAIGGTSMDIANSIALDATGQVYIAGQFQGTADFNPAAAAANLTSVGGVDIFFAKYDTSGNYVWAKSVGSVGEDIARSIALNSSGQVHVAGYFSATADFNPAAATNNLVPVGGGQDIFIAKYDNNGNYLWAKVVGGNSPDDVNSMAIDSSGNVHITGYFQLTADFDPSAATSNLVAGTSTRSCFVAAYSTAGAYSNALNIGGYPNQFFSDHGVAVKTDNLGNVYIVGTLQGTADFDPSATVANLTSAGSRDIVIAKYDANGNYLWAKAIGGVSDDLAGGMTIDNNGQVYVVGTFQATADFDPSGATASLTSVGGVDAFFAKYDTNGNYIWAKSISGGSNENGLSIAVDNSNQVFVTGFFYGTADFDPSGVTANMSPTGGYDTYIAKYDANGNYIWAKKIGGMNDDYATYLTLDNSGQIHITGYFNATADFDPSVAVANLTSFGVNDIFIAKYDTNGNYIWARNMGGTSNDNANCIAVNTNGDVFITGYFQNTADFDPSGATANLSTFGGQDIFIAKYDSAGSYLWAKNMGGASNEYGNSIALDSSSQLFITGFLGGSADFDPSAATDNLTTFGNSDVFIAKYDTNGNYLWAKNGGGTGSDSGYSIALNANGDLNVTGFFNDTADFEPLNGTGNVTSLNANDIFVAKYHECFSASVPTVSATSTTICASGSSTLSITAGSLNSATQWQWYSTSCGGSSIGSGTSVTVSPGTTTTYYVRGEGGCATSGSCATITITVADTTAPVVPTLSDVTGQCSATPSAPTTTDNCAGTVTGTTATAFPITTQGTTIVTWTFADGNGNTSTATQNVIINDSTAPVVPTLSDVTGQCSATPSAPTTTDNCAGTVTGTTATAFPITTQGTTVVTWTFTDGNGNTSTATQNVIINDSTAPVVPTLSDVTGQCSVTPMAPTTTDNCAGTVTGTTATAFPITTQGT